MNTSISYVTNGYIFNESNKSNDFKYNTIIEQRFNKIISILNTLVSDTEWNYLHNSNTIHVFFKNHTIYLSKLYFELEEISIYINPSNDSYHFSLPIKNSVYNYYTKIHGSDNACKFLETYISHLP